LKKKGGIKVLWGASVPSIAEARAGGRKQEEGKMQIILGRGNPTEPSGRKKRGKYLLRTVRPIYEKLLASTLEKGQKDHVLSSELENYRYSNK